MHPVGTKLPNDFGLYDMHGNVYEWCEDVYDRTFYGKPEALLPNPLATAGSGNRVFRGGTFRNFAQFARSADRFSIDPSDRAPSSISAPPGRYADFFYRFTLGLPPPPRASAAVGGRLGKNKSGSLRRNARLTSSPDFSPDSYCGP